MVESAMRLKRTRRAKHFSLTIAIVMCAFIFTCGKGKNRLEECCDNCGTNPGYLSPDFDEYMDCINACMDRYTSNPVAPENGAIEIDNTNQ
jgi:hypothetical protein